MIIERDLRIRIGADARRIAELALMEDGIRDVTTDACIVPGQFATGSILFKSGGVLAGTPYADAVAITCGLDPIVWYEPSGAVIDAGRVAGIVQGDLAAILRAERPLLNLLQRAAGIATATRAYVDAAAGTRAQILHTRKTAPGLRLLDVTSVLAGGGAMHRLDLTSTLMVKDNHWRGLARSGRTLADALTAAGSRGVGDCFVEVETPAQLEEACQAGATRLLIDNQSAATVAEWSRLARAKKPDISIEATGGITLANVRSYAEAGADFISIGALTHSTVAADVSLEVNMPE
ncbi:MAG: carboxylating nicotinate-nucleotide diphosphorylase [Gemmatimonadota bacterium]